MKERLGPDLAAKGLSTSGKDFHTPPTISPFFIPPPRRWLSFFQFFNFSTSNPGGFYVWQKKNECFIDWWRADLLHSSSSLHLPYSPQSSSQNFLFVIMTFGSLLGTVIISHLISFKLSVCPEQPDPSSFQCFRSQPRKLFQGYGSALNDAFQSLPSFSISADFLPPQLWFVTSLFRYWYAAGSFSFLAEPQKRYGKCERASLVREVPLT